MTKQQLAPLGVIAFAVLGCIGQLSAGWAQQPTPPPTSGRDCLVERVDYLALEVGGQPMYVNAQAFSVAGRRALLLGVPNYIWARPGSTEEPHDFVADSVFGVVVAPDGRVDLVPSPFPHRVVSPQAAALPDGTWLVVFGEVAERTDDRPAQRWQTLWSGVYDGRAWTQLHRLELPAGLAVDENVEFSLAVNGEHAAVALAASPVDGSLPPGQVLLARWRAEGWSTSVVRVPGGGRYQAPYAVNQLSLLPWGNQGFALIAKRDDMSLATDAPGFSSLFLYTPGPPWRERRVFAGVARASVRQFTGLLHGDLSTITWIDGSTVIAYASSALAPAIKEVVVDSGEARVDSRVIGLSNGTPMWITQHWKGADLSADTSAHLRFFTMQGDTVLRIAELPSPFMWFQAAVRSDGNTVALVGATPLVTSGDTIVHSGILRVRTDCK